MAGLFGKIVSLLVLVGIISSTAANAQVIEEVVESKVTALEGSDLYRARHVLRRFFSTEKSPECYRVLFSEFQGNLAVEFIPKGRGPIVYHEGEEPPAVKPPCGENIGYVLDRRGRVLRRLYSR